MAHKSGKTGSVDIGGAIAGIKDWDLSYEMEPLDTTDFADVGVTSYIPGITKASGSFSGYKEGVPQALTTGAAVAVVLNETDQANEEWQFNAFITKCGAKVSFDGLVEYSYDFVVTGAVTIPTA